MYRRFVISVNSELINDERSWFTEVFDTLDLQAEKALLGQV